MNEYELKGSC